MNWKHLFWVVPIVLIIGGVIGFKIFAYTTDTLSNMVLSIDKCSIQTLEYVSTHNQDCQIMISGYLRNCINNQTVNDTID